jgi:phage terminase large subunit|tara:strand:+ start:410 stop:1561 length:1152 start_codon:yes stop_codon:yes gene_type:complete
MFQKTTAILKIQKLKKRNRIIQGGTSASKTFGILACLIDHLALNPGLECSVVAQTYPHLKRGALRDFKKIMEMTSRWFPARYNKSSSTYQFLNGSTIEFFSADIESKLRGARRNILFLNEANTIPYDAYIQLAVRTSDFLYIDFNPTHEFWAHTELKSDADTDWLVLTYKDNEAAPEAAVNEILKAKAKAEKGNSFWQNWHDVYGLGKIGKLSGAIFQNWEIGEFKEISKSIFGQDYGMNDPTTLIQTSIDKSRKIIYAKECFYLPNLVTSEIAKLNKRYAGDNLIVADSAEPRLISELSKQSNIKPSIKGQGSVNFGISMIQDYQIIVDPKSHNLINELKNYIWLEKKSQTPIDNFNHCIDALRYAVSFQLANPYAGEYHII